jgi:hypothetical protein
MINTPSSTSGATVNEQNRYLQKKRGKNKNKQNKQNILLFVEKQDFFYFVCVSKLLSVETLAAMVRGRRQGRRCRPQ